jgi:hypothetical protein
VQARALQVVVPKLITMKQKKTVKKESGLFGGQESRTALKEAVKIMQAKLRLNQQEAVFDVTGRAPFQHCSSSEQL